eukprot:TRINITY_DN1035_c0_g1_i2.p1 TRINITY_DN1035_c0_g1~~TRINITY_DN1035_c0_g1_i2.p1  ORF type:complete len:210 (+),score=87.30 TRINITY_DN1035_c0_g1_i2:66-632(+)
MAAEAVHSPAAAAQHLRELQGRRAGVYRELEQLLRRQLQQQQLGGPEVTAAEQRAVLTRVGQEFAAVNAGVRELEGQLRAGGDGARADVLRQLQLREKRKIELTHAVYEFRSRSGAASHAAVRPAGAGEPPDGGGSDSDDDDIRPPAARRADQLDRLCCGARKQLEEAIDEINDLLDQVDGWGAPADS